MQKNEQDLLMKNNRFNFWEKYHEVPTMEELKWGRVEVEHEIQKPQLQ